MKCGILGGFIIPLKCRAPFRIGLYAVCFLDWVLFAYYAAGENGCDIDKSKNLAKSVTAE